MNNFFKYLHHKYAKDNKKWYPFLSVFYLTYECHFKCPYCCDGHGTPYYLLQNNCLNASQVFEVLREIRKHTPYLVITGGEPLNYPELGLLLEKIPQLKFKEIAFTTNGYNFEKHATEICKNISSLIFSIDTLNAEKADAIYGIGKGAFDKIMTNIELAKSLRKKGQKIVISSVAQPNNIADLYELTRFCKTQGFTHAVAPQLCGVKAKDELENNVKYKKYFDYLIREKKSGSKIFGTKLYLEYMRDLKKFTCYPFTMLVVSPTGDVFYPCLEIGHYAGNLLHDKNLHKIRINGEEKFGTKPDCGNQCHSACALGFGLLISQPFKNGLA